MAVCGSAVCTEDVSKIHFLGEALTGTKALSGGDAQPFREQWRAHLSVSIVPSSENHSETQDSCLKRERLSVREEISPKYYYKV